MRRERPSASGLPPDFDPTGLRFAVVVSRFNEEITEELLAGALASLRARGVDPDCVDVFWVPGAWELPQAAARIVAEGGCDAVVALGCVIRGETPHFDFISLETTRGLGAVARSAPVPVALGVLTTDTLDQARERADRFRQDKGGEAALAALEMVDLYHRLEGDR